MISFASGNSLLSYLTGRTPQNAGSAGNSAAPATGTVNANVSARVTATTQAALQVAGSRHEASVAGRALDKQQATLAADLRAAIGKTGVKLTGPVEFSVGRDGAVAIKASEADKAATSVFLKADTSRPSFATRIATQARDALKLSGTIQQSAAISQAARYGGTSSGVMSLYTSLMQQTNTAAAVFTVGSGSSSLSYPGSLAVKA